MKSQILNKNIVLLGDFQPVQFDKLFFIKNELLNEEDILPTSIFLPDLTIIDTDKFLIEINNNKFAITYKYLDNFISPSFFNIEKTLKNSVVKAFGFNFKINIFLRDISETKKYFYFEGNILNKHFNSENTAYGYYVSKDLDSCRLKLDIKPVQLQKIGEDKLLEAIDFNFNFHFENSDYSTQLKKYSEFENLTLEIINSYE